MPYGICMRPIKPTPPPIVILREDKDPRTCERNPDGTLRLPQFDSAAEYWTAVLTWLIPLALVAVIFAAACFGSKH